MRLGLRGPLPWCRPYWKRFFWRLRSLKRSCSSCSRVDSLYSLAAAASPPPIAKEPKPKRFTPLGIAPQAPFKGSTTVFPAPCRNAWPGVGTRGTLADFFVGLFRGLKSSDFLFGFGGSTMPLVLFPGVENSDPNPVFFGRSPNTVGAAGAWVTRCAQPVASFRSSNSSTIGQTIP